MRPIKFRGKRIDNGEWVYGDGVVIVDNDYAAIPQTKNVTSKDYKMTLCKVIPETVGQYTGLNDKSEKEIYDGDLCKGPNGKHWVVEWERYSWIMTNESIPNGISRFGGYETYPFDKWIKFHTSQILEIIGNIHDNKELLTQ